VGEAVGLFDAEEPAIVAKVCSAEDRNGVVVVHAVAIA
jgi:hypothetical protein